MAETRIPPRYRVIEEVGQGGMAVVYRAEDETLKRQVAIKLLHPHLSAEPESRARLEREAQAVAKLRHDNILEIFDYSGRESEASYLVTEFIDGCTLKQFLANRSIRHPQVAALVAIEVAAALAHAHAAGIIHRDVKPENVMIRKDGLIKLMDFGIAQVIDLQRMTVTGQLLGSPAYMAPELIEGKPLDFRTDVFAVGIILYQMATGELPFHGKNPHEVLKKITDGKYVDPRARTPLVCDALAAIIAKALARDPAARYGDVSLFMADLRAYLGEGGIADPRAELRGYFADPEAFEALLAPRVVTALLGGGRRELGAGRGARALGLWSRALALDAKNPAVLAGLRKLEGQRRVRTALFVGAGIAGLAGLAWAGLDRRDGAPGAPVAVASAPAPAAAIAPPEPAAVAASPEPSPPAASPLPRARVAVARPKPSEVAASPEPAPSNYREFKLSPTPQNADVFLDDKFQFAYGPERREIRIPWDKTHRITFKSSSCCEPTTIEVGPNLPLPADGTIVAELRLKNASLLVTVTPDAPDAIVSWQVGSDPQVPIKAGQPAPVAFKSTDEGAKQVRVKAGSASKELFGEEVVTVSPGQQTRVDIKLQEVGKR